MQGVKVSCLQGSGARERGGESVAMDGRSESEETCAVISLDVLAYGTVEGDAVPEQRGCNGMN